MSVCVGVLQTTAHTPRPDQEVSMRIDLWVLRTRQRVLALGVVCLGAVVAAPALAASGTFLGPLKKTAKIASTVPANGDVNPYGVAVAPVSSGKLVAGDVLVSNFNDKGNKQGTGKTIVEISPKGHVSLFASLNASMLPGACPGGVGLTTALVALRSGWVIVGSLPAKTGSSSSMRAGCLLVINPSGEAVESINGAPINGPWDMTAVDNGSTATLFVSNVLNGTVKSSPKTTHGGTVVRIDLSIPSAGPPVVSSETVIGMGFPERTDPSALVVGPTGLGISNGTLFVANSAANSISAITGAMTRSTPIRPTTITKGHKLNDPLGLTIAPNGDILAANGGNGNLVEITPSGRQVAVRTLDTTSAPPAPSGSGALFGLVVAPGNKGVYYVDDAVNTLRLLH
jgi:hypothetical protein